MSDRRTFRLISPSVRAAACRAIAEAPEGHLCEIKEPTRSAEQNRLLWPLLTDVSRQVRWPNMKGELVKLRPEAWKDQFTAALKKAHNEEQEMYANLDYTGWVMFGESTSVMPKTKFSELVELIYAFGAERGVVWSGPKE